MPVAAAAGLNNLVCVKGLFEDTAPQTLATAGRLALIHIDCDIYSAVVNTYDASKPYMVKGGYVVLDDPPTSSCLGAFEAMEEVMIRRDELHGALKVGKRYGGIVAGHLLIGAVRNPLAGQTLPVTGPVDAESAVAIVDQERDGGWHVGTLD